ncbi:gastric triacylglycerol lipase-like isoform X1 [Dermacentor albipictus]|uniref:gastric triacylglycerol lipase-like isoform X1 n=2 Tax=Dermacentor albipictus TaxID=60249 RepID=UPI0038FC2201
MTGFLIAAFLLGSLSLLNPSMTIGSAATEVAEQAKLPPAELMRYFGYNVEVHKVTTADGYILEVDRILPNSKDNRTEQRTPMLLVHGLLGNAVSWVANLPSQSPGFLLADDGFDVWLLNERGVPQSNYHVNLTTNDPKFWKWSFEEVGTFDIPATIDYILNVTGFSKVGLLTTSQGTTSSLVLLSMLPEYNDKVNIFVGYASVGNLTYFTSPVRLLIPFAEEVKGVNDFITRGGFLVTNPVQQATLATTCDSVIREICYAPLAILFGKNPKQHNSTRVPVYVANLPVGSSSQNLLHYAQVYRAKNLVRFDYGKEENMAKYGQADPPPYPLEKIRVPFAIYQGLGDIFADPQDVDDLAERLQDVLVLKQVMPDPQFGHLDFIFGYNATDFLHRHMINLVSNYTSTSA